MSTILFPSPVFGPVRSRRLGLSLGINLLPADGKICSFDCIYCECGRNADHRAHDRMPSRELVRSALEEKLRAMKAEGDLPDVITFAGNGEPTGHPAFRQIMFDVAALRDRYAPGCGITVLTNAFHMNRPEVVEALGRADLVLMKLDTVNEDFIRAVDRPNAKYDVGEIVRRIAAFDGHRAVQTMFLTGTFEGRSVDNTSDAFVDPWLEALKKIRPELVTIYTIDRETPEKGLKKAAPDVLDAIADRVRALGFTCTVSY